MAKLDISGIRKDYKKMALLEKDTADNPLDQFQKWFREVQHSEVEEPTAMILTTVAENKMPSARVVLLKGMDEKGFYFYTNYNSQKGREIMANPQVAVVFFWKELERQVRIQGTVTKVSEEQSDAYYLSRPRGSQIGAWSSSQSQEIASRTELEEQVQKVKNRFDQEKIYRPPFWGGFLIKPAAVEFWQGRPSRLHDRICYRLTDRGSWQKVRLAP